MEESKKKTTSTKESNDTSKNVNKKNSKQKNNKKTVAKNESEKKDVKLNSTQQKAPAKSTKKKSTIKKTSQNSTKKSVQKDEVLVEKKVTKEVVKPVEKESTSKAEKVSEEKSIKKTKKSEVKNQEKELEKTIIFDGRQNKNIADVVNKLEEENIVLEDRIIKRSKIKKIVIVILILIIVGIILATSLYVVNVLNTDRENSKTLDSNIYKKVSEKYKNPTDINKNQTTEKEETIYSNIETISLANFEEKVLSREDITIMVASETCYASMSFEPIVNEVFKEASRTIYKINISKLSSDEIDVFRTYYAFKSTPTIFTIKAGIVTADSVGNISKEDFSEWVKENVQ